MNQNQRYEVRMDFPGYECRMAFPEASTPQNCTYRVWGSKTFKKAENYGKTHN